VRILWDGEAVETDIDQTKNIFRKRGWVARFFDAHRVRAGDRLVLEQLAPYLYRLARAGGPEELGLDVGFTSWLNAETHDLV
jgi:hypothetical protein